MANECLNILVVDDQQGVRYLLDTIVKEEGHNCFLASNGLEAVEMYRKVRPDLVFMDIRMPVMDGTEALEKMKEQGLTSNVIMMTAFTERDAINNAYKNGASKCLIKPFDVNEIRQLIHNATEKIFPNTGTS